MNQLLYEQRKLALIEEITRVFEGVSRENGVSLSEAWIIDDYGSDEERVEARKRDTETRWQDVPDDDICFGYSCLSFLDEIGFHYYIPAYIVWYLRNMDNEDPEPPSSSSTTFDSLIFHLTLENWGGWEEYYLRKYSLFTPQESKAIAQFLQFDAEREDVCNRECDQMFHEMLSKEGLSQEEIDVRVREIEQMRIEHDSPENHARRALERYWGQFL
jgi:hypothetical protein